MLNYKSLSKKLQEEIANNTKDTFLTANDAIRRNNKNSSASLWRPEYVCDIERIIHSPYYNRYTDKTQVFSFMKNDDISRRALHVQLVSRIAKNIGRILGLNLDLIEAISLGHDIGHTPFGHTGETLLSNEYKKRTGRYFFHNLHSVRVLDEIFNYNLSLQTLDGILCHNGEFEKLEYVPSGLKSFDEFDKIVESCYTSPKVINSLIPSTLEGCVVRISDIIAYIGKDRQDAIKTGLIDSEEIFSGDTIGKYNAEIINNLIVNIIENSYGKDKICMDKDVFSELRAAKEENYRLIYHSSQVAGYTKRVLEPIFEAMYGELLDMVKSGNKDSVIYTHHIDYINQRGKHYRKDDYSKTDPDRIVTDFIASMTDDYFIDLYHYLFPDKEKITYTSYFD